MRFVGTSLDSEPVNESGAPERAPQAVRIQAQSEAVAPATASICNDERRRLGCTSGCAGFVHRLSPYPEGIEAQTRQVLKNLQTVLAGCGLGLEHALSVRIYLSHFDADYAAMNAVYASHFESGRRPARTCIGVTGLAKGARIEIDLVARRSGVPIAAGTLI